MTQRRGTGGPMGGWFLTEEEKKEQPKEEYVYTFRGHCETLSITKSFDHVLTDAEKAYWNGYVDGLCNPLLHYC